MNRTIGMERTYWLGDFRNLKISDFISDIPEELVLNPEVMALLRSMQLQSLDLTYLKYVDESVTRVEDVLNSSPEKVKEVIRSVEITRKQTFESLHEAFASSENQDVENSEEE